MRILSDEGAHLRRRGAASTRRGEERRMNENIGRGDERPVRIPFGQISLAADFCAPKDASGVVLFAHGSGSSRHSPRNRRVARILREAGLATLLLDLLTPDEEEIDAHTGHLRFDIEFLARRLISATDWLAESSEGGLLPVGYFGASTGAGAALLAAAQRPAQIHAVVSRGGRPDLAHTALPDVCAPTLLIVGGLDTSVIHLNREAFARLGAQKRLEIIPGATHLFEEPGALDEVARLARDWFIEHLERR
jgi:putative phosphoribosyl transferase